MSDYLVIVEEGPSGGWGAWSPDLNVYATGASQAEVEERVRDAIAFHLEGLRQDDLPIPRAASSSIVVTV